ncbi:MAG TPA: MAPEG family protein, partial [Burkholderiaceae bacterium]|nr:MAPEG family protein [Burkholderiaceae bacterium]
MKQEFILLPVLAMVVLTIIVWGRMYLTRVGEMRARRIRPQEVKTRVAGAVLQDTAASDNFMNLFELPVLFYALVILIFVMGLTDSLYVV